MFDTFCSAVRSLRFSACGRFLAMAEARDYVRIVDVVDGEFKSCEVLAFFGDIAGISFTPNAERIYVAISDRTYSGLMAYERSAQSHTSYTSTVREFSVSTENGHEAEVVPSVDSASWCLGIYHQLQVTVRRSYYGGASGEIKGS